MRDAEWFEIGVWLLLSTFALVMLGLAFSAIRSDMRRTVNYYVVATCQYGFIRQTDIIIDGKHSRTVFAYIADRPYIEIDKPECPKRGD